MSAILPELIEAGSYLRQNTSGQTLRLIRRNDPTDEFVGWWVLKVNPPAEEGEKPSYIRDDVLGDVRHGWEIISEQAALLPPPPASTTVEVATDDAFAPGTEGFNSIVEDVATSILQRNSQRTLLPPVPAEPRKSVPEALFLEIVGVLLDHDEIDLAKRVMAARGDA